MSRGGDGTKVIRMHSKQTRPFSFTLATSETKTPIFGKPGSISQRGLLGQRGQQTRSVAAEKVHSTSQAGFTLIEIIVVMTIIGILAALGMGNFVSSQVKSRDARRKADLRQISTALETYYNDFGAYPASLNGQIMGCGSDGAQACTWGDTFSVTSGGGDTVYMVTLPVEKNNQQYFYTSALTSYQLYARLENLQDGDIPVDGSGNPEVYVGTDCGSDACNYGVASTNSSLASTTSD